MTVGCGARLATDVAMAIMLRYRVVDLMVDHPVSLSLSENGHRA